MGTLIAGLQEMLKGRGSGGDRKRVNGGLFSRRRQRPEPPVISASDRCLTCPMCNTTINAESIEGICASCPLYQAKGGCRIDLIACPACGYHSLPHEHGGAPLPRAGGNGGAAPGSSTTMDPDPDAPDAFQRQPGKERGGSAFCSGAMRLNEVRAGTRVRLLGFHGIDDNHLGRLTAYGLLPGVTVEVLQRFPAIILGVYQAELALETELAEGVWVLPG